MCLHRKYLLISSFMFIRHQAEAHLQYKLLQECNHMYVILVHSAHKIRYMQKFSPCLTST